MRTVSDDQAHSDDDRTSITEALLLGRDNLIEQLAGLNDQLEETSRRLAESDRPPARSRVEELEDELV